MLKIGELIKLCRETAGLTQSQVAWLCDTTQPYICRIEAGEVSPSIELAEAILETCGYELGVRKKKQ